MNIYPFLSRRDVGIKLRGDFIFFSSVSCVQGAYVVLVFLLDQWLLGMISWYLVDYFGYFVLGSRLVKVEEESDWPSG